MTAIATTERMNGKPVYTVPAKAVLNMDSGFRHKLLCDGPTFTAGSACAYSCTFCYVPPLMRKSPHLAGIPLLHSDVVIRRTAAVAALVKQLSLPSIRRRASEPLVLYMSPLVDIAANLELRDETIEACHEILSRTEWQIRLLSKSNLLPSVAHALVDHRDRLIFGVSTGTLDNGLARSFELHTPLVSKRLAALHQLQDEGFRTFGMICPSLPQADYGAFARAMYGAIRADRCEHVWAEVMNVRGDSLTQTVAALREHGYNAEAGRLHHVSTDGLAWENYARATFEAHAPLYQPGQLRFLQYVTKKSRPWWAARMAKGAVLL
jgi:DNA repair photolyase